MIMMVMIVLADMCVNLRMCVAVSLMFQKSPELACPQLQIGNLACNPSWWLILRRGGMRDIVERNAPLDHIFYCQTCCTHEFVFYQLAQVLSDAQLPPATNELS